MTPNEIIKEMDDLSEGIKRKHHDCVTMSQVVPQAAALIREMREMLRKYNEKTQNDPVALCLICERLTCDTDCKLAQMLKD